MSAGRKLQDPRPPLLATRPCSDPNVCWSSESGWALQPGGSVWPSDHLKVIKLEGGLRLLLLEVVVVLGVQIAELSVLGLSLLQTPPSQKGSVVMLATKLLSGVLWTEARL